MALDMLFIGIDWAEFDKLFGEKSEEMQAKVRGMIEEDTRKLKEVGVDSIFMHYGAEESMDRLEGVLKEKEWKAVCIGAGIRLTKDYTPLFERLVNTIASHSKAKMVFNTSPDSTMAAVQRWFPEAK